jgi:signal transduction histidine kinase
VSEPRAETAASAKWWAIALVATVVACLIAAAVAIETDEGSWGPVALTALIAGAYCALFFVVARRAEQGSTAAWIVVAATVIAAGALTAVVPSSALFQFWAYPFVWTLLTRVPHALGATLLLAVAVFGGFAVSTGDEAGWLPTAALTQGISFAVNVVMGLWITSVYRYGQSRERLLGELTAAQDELAVLHRDAGTTSERERLSRELHDTLAQSLAGVVLLVQRSRRDLAAGALTDETLELIEDSARTALAETRTLVAGSAPVELDGGGIGAALETLAERFRRETGLIVDIEVAIDAPLGREVDVAFLRCAQEGLANIRRHSDARAVSLSLREEGDAAVLRVGNDGRGFDPASGATGFGLAGLRARLELIGGSLAVDGTEGAVALVARVPRGVSA